MLSLHEYQPFLRPFMTNLWPLYRHTGVLQEVRSSLEQLEKLQHKISEEIQPVTCTAEKEGRGFAWTLDTKDFSPEELSVKQMGRKLQVSGKTEMKQEDGKGAYSYRMQEFSHVFDLPEGENPETVTCFMTDGKLHIQTPANQLSEAPERIITIDCSETVKTEQPETVKIQNNTTETQKTV